MTEVGKPAEIPEIEIIPREDPVPRERPEADPAFPKPTKVPLHDPEPVPEHEPAREPAWRAYRA